MNFLPKFFIIVFTVLFILISTLSIINFTVLFILISTLSIINVRDNAITTYTNYESNVKDIENIHDKTWKTIQESGAVLKMKKDEYIQMLNAFVERGASYEGNMMTWVQESLTVNNNEKLAEKLMDIIRNARDELSVANKNANYAATTHNQYVRKTMNGMLLSLFGGKYGKEVEIKQITSGRSKEALETGEDNETLSF